MRSVALCAWNVQHRPLTQLGHPAAYNEVKSFHSHSRLLFLDDLFRQTSGNREPRTLQARRKLPYPTETLFKTVASVNSYPDFLPFIHSSNILSRDRHGWPARVALGVGYGGYSETFTSQVDCDQGKGTVRARAGDNADEDEAIKQEGMFETLDTLWRFSDVSSDRSHPETEAVLTVKVKFRSPIYDALLAAVEGKVAGAMIEAFEKRLRDEEGPR